MKNSKNTSAKSAQQRQDFQMWFLQPEANLLKTQLTPKANHNGRPPPQHSFD
ncbi:MAG: hypothetical protein ACKV1O_30105 [Saprospiraceae bacterium]